MNESNRYVFALVMLHFTKRQFETLLYALSVITATLMTSLRTFVVSTMPARLIVKKYVHLHPHPSFLSRRSDDAPNSAQYHILGG